MSKVPNKKRIQELSEKWLNGTITETEKQEYDLWYHSFEDHEIPDLSSKALSRIQKKIHRSILEHEGMRDVYLKDKKIKNFQRRILYAASISLFILTACYFYYSFFEPKSKIASHELLYSSILPGRDRAVLSLDNGLIFDLDSLNNGEVFRGNGILIEKMNDAELIYSIFDSSAFDSERVLMSTISTPRGGQYRISLPDGSKVWLNAASTLKTPIAFISTNRDVELSGEGYFEVSKDNMRPFRVITENEQVEVLGTHFNVSSYEEDEISRVSLLEGKVKVLIGASNSKILDPGQQTVVKEGLIEVASVDLREAVAWKNGEFMFNNESIESIMRKVARWYDVDVSLAPEVRNISIWGSVSKYKNINEVLKIIELTGDIHFTIEGRRVYGIK